MFVCILMPDAVISYVINRLINVIHEVLVKDQAAYKERV